MVTTTLRAIDEETARGNKGSKAEEIQKGVSLEGVMLLGTTLTAVCILYCRENTSHERAD